MATLAEIKSEHKKLAAQTDDPEIQARQQRIMRTLPPEMATAVGQLMLLYGMPFGQLVPDWRMLPPNAMRFFYIDANWLDSLLDGAFSVGVQSKRDLGHQRMLTPLIRLLAENAAPELRPSFQEGVALGEFTAVNPAGSSGPAQITWCGFLLRSPVVSGWPGLEVVAYRSAEEITTDAENEQDKIPLLRLERLAPDILFGIFQEVPQRVAIHEPAEGLHFGISDGDVVKVRNPNTGALNGESVNINFHGDKERRVLNVKALHEALSENVSPDDDSFGPADFALQMITAARKQLFRPLAGAVESGNGGN